MLLDQLGRGLGPDPANAGHIVDRVAHQRQHIADQRGGHAEFLDHFRNVDADILHGVEHVDIAGALGTTGRADQLHQILVGGDDGHLPALRGGGASVGSDQIVGLQPGFLDAGQRESTGRLAHQRELRHQILRRGGAVGLVGGEHLVAERGARLVEDDGKVRRPVGLVQVVRQLPQHGGIAIDRAHRGARRIGQRGQAVIGPEDVGRPVDEVEVRGGGAGHIHRHSIESLRGRGKEQRPELPPIRQSRG